MYAMPRADPNNRPIRDKVNAMKAKKAARAAAARPGFELFDETAEFVETLIYAPRPIQTIIVLGSAISHIPRSFSAVPRFGVLGGSESGKSSVLDVFVMLGYNAWMSDATIPGLRAWYNEPGEHFLVIDEIGKAVFGESGLQGKRHPAYKIMAEGYRRTATLSLSVERHKEDMSIYGVCAYAGISKSLPEDIRKRSILFEMTPLPDDVYVDDTIDEDVIATGQGYSRSLHDWMSGNAEAIADYAKSEVRLLHPSLNARRRQIWGPLFATAALVGGDWPERVMEAYLALGIDTPEKPALTPGQQLILDVANIARNYELTVLFNDDVIDELQAMDERPYGERDVGYLISTMKRILGPERPVTGYNVAGIYGSGPGRLAGPVRERADALIASEEPSSATRADPYAASLGFTPAPSPVEEVA